MRPVYVVSRGYGRARLYRLFPRLRHHVTLWARSREVLRYSASLDTSPVVTECGKQVTGRCGRQISVRHDTYFRNYTVYAEHRERLREMFSVKWRNHYLARQLLANLTGGSTPTDRSNQTVRLGEKATAGARITTVGVHVRRGDFASTAGQRAGRKVVSADYLERAMRYFRERHATAVFVVCSDDIPWCESAINDHSDTYFSRGRNPEQDLTLLTQCDHMIMSTGTFGFWAAFFNGGHVVYSREQFVRGGELWQTQWPTYQHLFPPHWVPL